MQISTATGCLSPLETKLGMVASKCWWLPKRHAGDLQWGEPSFNFKPQVPGLVAARHRTYCGTGQKFCKFALSQGVEPGVISMCFPLQQPLPEVFMPP
jgi:hypothetical protein